MNLLAHAALLIAAVAHPQHHDKPRHHARDVLASEYGPADSGGTPACYKRVKGVPSRLSYRTVGVANRTLPCGTRVWLRVLGHRQWLHVRVIDRGPYCCGRQFDLTYRTARLAGVRYPWSGTLQVAR
jgi:rare lipoprotein A (peptidoglycan hydrolase)